MTHFCKKENRKLPWAHCRRWGQAVSLHLFWLQNHQACLIYPGWRRQRSVTLLHLHFLNLSPAQSDGCALVIKQTVNEYISREFFIQRIILERYRKFTATFSVKLFSPSKMHLIYSSSTKKLQSTLQIFCIHFSHVIKNVLIQVKWYV